MGFLLLLSFRPPLSWLSFFENFPKKKKIYLPAERIVWAANFPKMWFL